jgi:hypothetical protein
MQGQSRYYYYSVLKKQHTALQECCFRVSSTTQEHRQKKKRGKSIQSESLQIKAQQNHFQQFLFLCVNMVMFLRLFYDAKQHRLCGLQCKMAE